MDGTRITIKSEFDAPEDAIVRRNLPIRALLDEIKKEFELPDGFYTLRSEGNGKVLDPNGTLEASGVVTGDTLVLSRERRVAAAPARPSATPGNTMALRTMSGKLPIMGSARASLKELATGEVYKIEWSPALIGRPTPDNADTLAVDLSKYAVAQSISRNHAEIIELDGSYFLESKSTTSKTALNGSELRRGERRLLQSEDKITCGQITLVFFVD